MRNKKGQFKSGYTRHRAKCYWDRKWLLSEYKDKKKSASQIAAEQGCTENNIFYFLNKNNIPRRSMQEIRGIKYWGQKGADNPMWNKKGELNPNYKGGTTPERQLFYQSQEWKKACSAVWKRDMAVCQRCSLEKETDMPFHIHHIKGFADRELRAELNNLILLCESCHRWVHSRMNKNNDYIQ